MTPVPGIGVVGLAIRPGRWRTEALTGALIVALLVVVHGPAVAGYFIGDDFIHIGQVVAEPWNLLANDDPDGWFRPLTKLAFALDHLMWGLEPRGYHVTNLALHGLAAWLVATVGRRVLGLGRTGTFAGLLFLVHPAHARTVSWISTRADLLLTLWALVALLAYWRLRRGGGRWSRVSLGTAVVLACASKETGIVVPLALLTLDRLGAFAEGGRRPSWSASLWTFAGLAALVLGFLLMRAWVLDRFIGGVAPGRLVWTLWLPYEVALAGLRLLVPVQGSGLGPGAEVFVGLLILALEGAALVGVVREGGAPRRALGLGGAWFLATVLPVAPLLAFRWGWGGERYLYLPGAGSALVLAVIVAQVPRLASPGWTTGWRATMPAVVVLTLLATVARGETVAWGAVTGAVPRIQRDLLTDRTLRPGDVVLVFNAPGNLHAGPPFDVMLQTQLERALAPPYFPLAIRANPYRLTPPLDCLHAFLWDEPDRRLVRVPVPPRAAPPSLPAWDGLDGWTSHDLRADGRRWEVVGPRPALVSPPLDVPSLTVAGLGMIVRPLACPGGSACDAWRRLVDTWHPEAWRLAWGSGDVDWRRAPAVEFRVPAGAGHHRVRVHLVHDARWVLAGSVAHLALLPPPAVDAFEVEEAHLLDRAGDPSTTAGCRGPAPSGVGGGHPTHVEARDG
jgi:hypothetical protein